MNLPPINVTHCVTCGSDREIVDLNCRSCADAKARVPYQVQQQLVPNAAGLLRAVLVREAK